MKLKWPWDHKEAAEHHEVVQERAEKVDELYDEAQKQIIENGLGQAVRRALSEQRRRA